MSRSLKAILAPLILIAASAAASPVNWLVEFVEPVDGFSADGFARVQLPLPEGAEILAVELIDKQLRIHASIDPDRPMVWRVIQLQAGTTPQTIPTERYLGLLRRGRLAIHAFDMGQFTAPVPTGTK